jgi:hypothetical protein
MLLSHQLLRELNEIRLGGERHALATAIFTSHLVIFNLHPAGKIRSTVIAVLITELCQKKNLSKRVSSVQPCTVILELNLQVAPDGRQGGARILSKGGEMTTIQTILGRLCNEVAKKID